MKLNLFKTIRFFFKYGGPVGYLTHYGRLLKSYGRAWDTGNIPAILTHFHDEFLYTDPIVQEGITNKTDLERHLEIVFARFPRQTWTTNATIYPHFTPYKFAISYEFSLSGVEPSFSGTGMEKITFQGDKLIEDRIHLQFREMDSRAALQWPISADARAEHSTPATASAPI